MVGELLSSGEERVKKISRTVRLETGREDIQLGKSSLADVRSEQGSG